MKRLLMLIGLLGSLVVRAQDGLPVHTLPAGLGQGAGAVMRQYEETFRVVSPGEAVETVAMIVTVLNERGANYARQAVLYDPFSKVTTLEGTLYDAAGKVIRRLKKGDIKDLSAISSGSFYEDYRQKTAEFAYAQYPFTVAFRYERQTRNLLFYPGWFPLADPALAVESARMRVIVPAAQALRYRSFGNLADPVQTETATERSYTWELRQQRALSREPYSTGYDRLGPGVLMAPAELELAGYRGRTQTWQALGQFMYELNANRDQLPERSRAAVAELVGGETDVRKKIQKIYAYVQQHTRYIFIKLGVGGWQTFPAAMVAEKGYGDCKALSNYTAALLKAAGIPAYLTLVMAGENKADIPTDFPSARFNHMVLCVPLERDSVWLECTSPVDPAGYMGSFTGNRHALLLTPEGGKLVRTPVYRPDDSRVTRRIELTIEGSGDARAEVRTAYVGLRAEMHQVVLHQLTKEEQQEWLYRRIRLPSYDLLAFALQKQPAAAPTVTERLTLRLSNGANRSGTRFFLTPNLLSVATATSMPREERKTAFQLPVGSTEVDTVICEFPPHTEVETLFPPAELTTPFGTYSASVRQEGTKLIYVRRLRTEGGTFPPAEYPAYHRFRQELERLDRRQVVLKELKMKNEE